MSNNLLTVLRECASSNIRVSNEYSKLGRRYNTNGNRYFTYALLLQNGRIYIGDSDSPHLRLMAHFEGSESSAKWVKENGPVKRILEITWDAPPGAERERFFEYASIFGFENVRGSNWCQKTMTTPISLENFERGKMSHKFMKRDEIHKIEKEIRELISERIL
jgi:hypothetical protein